MSERDTIAAIATPPGRGAIAIVRCSGRDARPVAARVFRAARSLVDRQATYGTIFDEQGNAIDRGLAIAFDAPATATGEDVVELHVHGSPIAARETLQALLAAGARLARAGEFTRRAYLNGKLDLSAAEAVADLIAAESRAAAYAATANLTGGLRRLIDAALAHLSLILEELAAAIDFPDEVAAPAAANLLARIEMVDATLHGLVHDSERGRLVREGLALAIVGPPNAGKSSVLNALIGEDRAIVSPLAGTTRDTIEETFVVDGVLVRAIDTAGLRQADDAIEQLGIDRARRALSAASVALVVVDASRPLAPEADSVLLETRSRPRVVFFNKRDLGTSAYDAREPGDADALLGSVFDPLSLTALRNAIAHVGWQGERFDSTRPHLAGVRQVQAVLGARDALTLARQTLTAAAPSDLIVGDLVAAVASLSEISGGAAVEALLDGIFARFCIGK